MNYHEASLRVRYAETDQMGIVYHANYFAWMEVGRIEFCRAAGLRYRDLEREEGILLSVVEVGARYSAPARYDDEIIVKTWVGEANPRMVVFRYEIREAAEGKVLVTGFTKHLFLGRDFKPHKLPERYRAIFAAGLEV